MQYRPLMATFPWVLVLLGSPIFLGVTNAIYLPMPENLLYGFYVLSVGAILLGVGLGFALTVVGLINQVRPVVIHGAAGVLLGVALMLYADSIPTKRYYSFDSDLDPQPQLQPREQ